MKKENNDLGGARSSKESIGNPAEGGAPEKANPPQDIQLGAHDLGDGKVSFALWAPWKKAVHVAGDFNDWKPEKLALAVSEEGVWWAIIELEPGEYAYQYVLDAEHYIADPYARKLKWGDSAQPHTIVTVGEQPYQWNDSDFQAPPFNELVIYELHVGDFSPEGTFKGVTAKLDYLQDLGINAIELMPIQEFPGDVSWGYNPAFFFTPESSYGSINDLKELIDQAHQRQIAVILDMVFNHTAGDNPITLLYAYDNNPYFSDQGNPWGFPDLDHWNEATKRYIYDIQRYWLEEFHIDGFRYDHVEGIGYDFINGASFMAWSARQIKPHVYLIAEQLQDPISVVHDTDMNASWHQAFERKLMAQLREGDFHGNSYGDMQGLHAVINFRSQGYSDNAQAVNYIESHDEERVCYEVQTNNLDYATALRKSKLGAVALFTACGVPMLYHGQEFGEDTPKTIDVNKLQWEKLDDPAVQDLRNTYQSLIMLRRSQEALRQNGFEALLVDDERKLIVFKRWTEGGSQVVVALNFEPTQQFAEIDFPRAGRWHEWMFDYDEDFGDQPHRTIEIPGSGAKVWVAI